LPSPVDPVPALPAGGGGSGARRQGHPSRVRARGTPRLEPRLARGAGGPDRRDAAHAQGSADRRGGHRWRRSTGSPTGESAATSRPPTRRTTTRSGRLSTEVFHPSRPPRCHLPDTSGSETGRIRA
jgi:hypothetical protein